MYLCTPSYGELALPFHIFMQYSYGIVNRRYMYMAKNRDNIKKHSYNIKAYTCMC